MQWGIIEDSSPGNGAMRRCIASASIGHARTTAGLHSTTCAAVASRHQELELELEEGWTIPRDFQDENTACLLLLQKKKSDGTKSSEQRQINQIGVQYLSLSASKSSVLENVILARRVEWGSEDLLLHSRVILDSSVSHARTRTR